MPGAPHGPSKGSTATAGDELLPDAHMVFDREAVVGASPEQVWPWLVQLGKHRAGWYLPARLERVIPRRRRALRRVVPRWQRLEVGDRVPDYGGRDERLEVVRIDAPHTLVYRSERRGAQFTWALLLTAVAPGSTRVHLRFRGRLRSRGLRRTVIVGVGKAFDAATGALMLAGLRERVDDGR